MDEVRWNELMAALRDRDDIERAVDAAQSLQRESTLEDIPRLRDLLKDKDFFVREAAAWPLSDLDVTDALSDLLDALRKGEDDGHDNDGLAASLMDLAERNPDQCLAMIEKVLESGNPRIREQAEWLRQFCE